MVSFEILETFEIIIFNRKNYKLVILIDNYLKKNTMMFYIIQFK